MRRLHLWLGLVTAIGVVVVSVSGILLNHRDALGLAPDVAPVEGATIEGAVGLEVLVEQAVRAAGTAGMPVGRLSDVNRLMYRPSKGLAAVRMNDPRLTEVVLDASDASVLAIGPRDDISIEHVHSGEVVGQRGVVLSDIVAVALVVLSIGGIWLWIRRMRRGIRRAATRWQRLHWRFHLVGGVAVAVFAVVLSVTGILLNHKRELGYMVEPTRSIDGEEAVKLRPRPLTAIVSTATGARSGDITADDVQWIDYRPLTGYAKVRFTDDREVVVDVYDLEVLSDASRRDVWIEKLHTGALLGGRGTLASDLAAVVLILLTANGVYLWLLPAWRNRARVREDDAWS